eukprot:Phypoly_transcript_08225.p1 GENE.Phypoly_transcript_08225~~Phypoly_transcript_08225.p1  ORF type:complete len:340 (+),score=22.79 Phypoly_transcript_08225:393-1412(+)
MRVQTCDPRITEVFFGNEDEPNARFISLRDCGHIFEVFGLDQWMDEEGSSDKMVTLKQCPKCKTPVRSSLRYGNSVKLALQDIEIIKIKTRKIQAELQEVQKKLKDNLDKMARAIENMSLWEDIYTISTRLEQKLDPHEINTIRNQVSLFPSLKALIDNRTESHEISDNVNALLTTIRKRVIDEQQWVSIRHQMMVLELKINVHKALRRCQSSLETWAESQALQNILEILASPVTETQRAELEKQLTENLGQNSNAIRTPRVGRNSKSCRTWTRPLVQVPKWAFLCNWRMWRSNAREHVQRMRGKDWRTIARTACGQPTRPRNGWLAPRRVVRCGKYGC